MAHHHHEPRATVVVDETDSATGIVVAIVAIVLMLFLIWAIFFSGWIMDRGTRPDIRETDFEQRREGDTDIDVFVPGEQERNETSPAPTTSPGG